KTRAAGLLEGESCHGNADLASEPAWRNRPDYRAVQAARPRCRGRPGGQAQGHRSARRGEPHRARRRAGPRAQAGRDPAEDAGGTPVARPRRKRRQQHRAEPRAARRSATEDAARDARQHARPRRARLQVADRSIQRGQPTRSAQHRRAPRAAGAQELSQGGAAAMSARSNTARQASTKQPAADASQRCVDGDFYKLVQLLDPADQAVLQKVRAFAEDKVAPIINHYWGRAEFPFELIADYGALGIAGVPYRGFGCPGKSTLLGGPLLAGPAP